MTTIYVLVALFMVVSIISICLIIWNFVDVAHSNTYKDNDEEKEL